MIEHNTFSTEPIGLEYTYNTGRLAVFGPKEEQIGPAIYLDEDDSVIAETVSEAYLHAGPGLHIIDHDEVLAAHEDSLRFMAQHLPRAVIRYGKIEESHASSPVEFVYFGNLAIRGRMANAQEIGAAKNEAQAYREAQEQIRREMITAKDNEKTNYATFDHARIQVGQSNFFLHFDLPQSVLAFRVLQHLGAMQPGELLYEGDMDKKIWQAMPIAERFLLDIGEDAVYSATPRPIAAMTHAVVHELGWYLGIIGDTDLRNKVPVSIELRAVPHPSNYAGEALPIVPPNTPRQVLDRLRDETKGVPKEVLNALRTTLSTLIEKPSWDHRDALEVLDIIMSAEGKVALFQLHGKSGRPLKEQHAQSEDAIEALHRRTCRTLGEDAYDEARNQRVIGGNRALTVKHVSVRQSGGKIEGLALRNEEPTIRWTVGKPQTLKDRFSS